MDKSQTVLSEVSDWQLTQAQCQFLCVIVWLADDLSAEQRFDLAKSCV